MIPAQVAIKHLCIGEFSFWTDSSHTLQYFFKHFLLIDLSAFYISGYFCCCAHVARFHCFVTALCILSRGCCLFLSPHIRDQTAAFACFEMLSFDLVSFATFLPFCFPPGTCFFFFWPLPHLLFLDGVDGLCSQPGTRLRADWRACVW